MLRHLRFPVEASRGRRYPEPDHPYRSAFQRDRDRVIHTRAFRRLENKTQVFAPALSDHFRNRLTHTLEVSQVARTAANVLGLDEDLTEALALVHDVGHPPFAHAGEESLNAQMKKYGLGFDHNIHALRIVEQLEQRYPRFPGLNLTFEVREGIVKHSRELAPGEYPDLDEYLPGLRPPLEAQLIDLADEIAYNTADLDDAHEAGILRPDMIAAAVPEYAAILDTVETRYPGASEREQFQETVRQLIDDLVSGLIEGTVSAARDSAVKDFDDVRRCPERVARFSAKALATSLHIKEFLHRTVYSSPALDQDRCDSMERLARLFEQLVARGDEPRSVCDFIAGMTDRYFLRFYETLNGASEHQSSTLEKFDSSASRTI